MIRDADGNFIAADGSVHEFESDAESRNRGGGAVSGSGSGGVADDMAGGALMLGFGIFMIVPKFIAKFIGYVFAFLFKLGIVGKIIQTMFVSLVAYIIIQQVLVSIPMPSFLYYFLLSFATMFPFFWYWIYHYDALKVMSMDEYSDIIKVSLCIAFYGTVFAMLGELIHPLVQGILISAVWIFTVVTYFKATAQVRAAEAANRTNGALKKAVMAGVAVLAVIGGITGSISGVADEAETEKLLAAHQESEAIFEQFNDAYNAKDNKKAVEFLTLSAQKGYRPAQYNLGLNYRYGKMDFEKNYEKAKEWFEKAAADDKRYDKWQSSQNSCIELGKIYRDGIGVEKNAAKAIEWFQIGGNEGYVNIAVMYRDGIGVKQDFDEAEKWFNKNNAAYTNAKTQEEFKKFNEMKKGK